ncbi:MAG: trimethylamine methyltransferase family protein [Clostridiales bacterium]
MNSLKIHQKKIRRQIMLDFNILKEEEMQEIVEGAYKILETIGVEVHNDKALNLLKGLGCGVEETRVTIPRTVVAKALSTVPSYLKIYDRDGNLAMDLGGRNSYYGSGPTCPNFIDARTGERRIAIKQDAADASVVADALSGIDFVMSLCMIGDQTRGLADLHEVDAMVRNSTKPIATWAFNGENTQAIIDMCAAVKGGLKELQEKPFAIVYAEPTTPLTHCKEALDKVMILAENKVPVIYSPGMLVGGTAPVTVAGAMTVGIAESLTGLVVHQTVCPGAPFISSCGGCVMDLKEMKTPYGAPESVLLYGASSEIYRYLGIPSFGLAGATDAKKIDAQAGYESALEIFINDACGGNLIHDIGFTDYGLTGSCHQMVMCDEIIGFVRRLRQGVSVNADFLAYDTVKEVGPGGNYLAATHTFEYFRKEIWSPQISERRSYEEWEADGKKDLEEVISEKIVDILDNHKVAPLSDEVIAKLDAIIAKSEKEIKA